MYVVDIAIRQAGHVIIANIEDSSKNILTSPVLKIKESLHLMFK